MSTIKATVDHYFPACAFTHSMCFTRSSACFSGSSGGGAEAEDQRGDAEKSGGGDQPEEAGTAAAVRTNDRESFTLFLSGLNACVEDSLMTLRQTLIQRCIKTWG